MAIPRKPYKWIIIPIESTVREYYGKLFFSLVAADRGWGVILAYKEIFNDLPKIEALSIDVNFKRQKQINKYLASGIRPSAWDEEGLVYNNPEYYLQYRLDEATMRDLELLFLWGKEQQEAIFTHVKGIEHKLILTGNPRFDLLRPELRSFFYQESIKLKKRYGRFLLVNTNFEFVYLFTGRANKIR